MFPLGLPHCSLLAKVGFFLLSREQEVPQTPPEKNARPGFYGPWSWALWHQEPVGGVGAVAGPPEALGIH